MSDAILFKPGALTTEERALMARHPSRPAPTCS
jgi:HD-GYP domain-containing protein (c-di-GMP phosphodiesterase class II)